MEKFRHENVEFHNLTGSQIEVVSRFLVIAQKQMKIRARTTGIIVLAWVLSIFSDYEYANAVLSFAAAYGALIFVASNFVCWVAKKRLVKNSFDAFQISRL